VLGDLGILKVELHPFIPEFNNGRPVPGRHDVHVEVTEAGRPLYDKARNCIAVGSSVLLAIDNFTIPAPDHGRIRTNVTYSYRITDLPEWIKRSETLQLFPDLSEKLSGEPIEAEVTFVDTSKGWVPYE
jgi:hypothetical protein